MIQRKKLGEIANISAGQGAPQGAENYSEEGTPFVKAGDLFDLVNGKHECDIQKVSEQVAKKHRLKLYPKGTVLFAKSGMSCMKGYVYATNAECYVVSHLACIMPFGVDSKYLKYYFEYHKPNQLVKDASYPSISLADIDEMPINVFDDQTQAKIVDNLDAVNSLIVKSKEELGLLDNIVKSRFSELFGERGKRVPLKDYVWFQEGPGVRSVDFTSDGTILLTGSNINDNQITFGHKSDRFVSNELAKGRYSHFMCDIDDILVVSSAIDPSKFDKKVTIVQKDKKYCLNTGIIRFKPNREYLTLSYFREFLKTDYFKHQVMEEMRGIAQMHFGPSHLKEMTILLPESLEDQVEFERFVSQVDKSKLAVKQSLEKLETLKKSLMQQYFG